MITNDNFPILRNRVNQGLDPCGQPSDPLRTVEIPPCTRLFEVNTARSRPELGSLAARPSVNENHI
jgi:hypothetical protein